MPDKNTDSPSAPPKQPAFEFNSDELEPFRGTGYEFVRLNVPNALDARGRPIGKAPGHGWRTVDPLDVVEAKALLDGGTDVGVRLRQTDLVIDVDPRAFDDGDDPVARLQADLGIKLDNWPKVETGSDGSHYYMTMPAGTLVQDTVESYPGIEFKAHGRQMVAPGSSHPATGKPYCWDLLAEPIAETSPAPDVLIDLIRRPDVAASVGAGDFDPEDVELMLTGLDASNYRDQSKWLEMMMACHHASAGEAREEFIAWSTSDADYADHEYVIGRRWDSLHGDDGGKRVTAKTLFKALHAAGQGDLIEQAIRSDPLDDFPDDLADLPDFIGEQPKNTLLDRINADRFTVLTSGKYLVGSERYDDRMQRHLVEWSPDEAIRKHMNIRSLELPNGKKEKLGNWWLDHSSRRQYDYVTFDPSGRNDSPNVYNLWRGWAVNPKKGNWSHLKQLLHNVLCRGDQESYDYVMRWCAFMVQHPDTPAEVALVFKGRKGTGKGTFCRSLKELAGQHGRQVAQPEHFTGRFNEHLADTILLFVDEGLWAGDKKVEGVLKNLITEPVLSFEGKNKPIIEGPNHLHIVIASNEDWVIPATPDERRFAVFETDEEAFKALPNGFFDQLREQMDNGGRAAMLYDLLEMDLGDWHPRKGIPQTEALVAQKVEGFRSDPIAYWWHRALEDGEIDYLTAEGSWPDAFVVGSEGKGDMLDSLGVSAKATRHRAEFSKKKVAQFLGRVGVDVNSRDRKGARVWAVPPLDQARTAFEKYVGGSIDWGE
ncbi:DUF5906 domain-containing protein [Altererythrobacter aquiaggeris]|uniref:DUF5906 domain-containing protein n=1 Tax=Aestuarierythrobacter aquiaggeris TaxID=1898396 RepID=UPI003018B3A0